MPIDILSPFIIFFFLTEGQNFSSALQSTLNNNPEMLNANKPTKQKMPNLEITVFLFNLIIFK